MNIPKAILNEVGRFALAVVVIIFTRESISLQQYITLLQAQTDQRPLWPHPHSEFLFICISLIKMYKKKELSYFFEVKVLKF